MRQDLELRASDATLIPLWKGVVVSYRRLFPDEPDHDPRLLDVIALALSALIPIYRTEADGRICELTDAEIVGGRFAHGARRLEFADGRPFVDDGLMICARELERALETLRVGPLQTARASLMLRHRSMRRVDEES